MKHTLSCAVASGLLCSLASAQWSTDPAAPLAVADAASDQNLAKLAATPDGGVWVSWFDGIASGWDVRVQKLDAAGNELLPHNGVLVADRSFSSTQDYGLSVDAAGNALVVFRDDRAGGIEVTAALVTPTGAQPWGVNGVALTSGAAFVANPKITGTADGGSIVGWMDNGVASFQKLDAAGVPQWGSAVSLTPPAGTYTVAGLHATGNDAIFSLVHQTGNFTSPKHLKANKISSTGSLLWGAGPLPVFDGGSLQFGNYPDFRTDGAGGAVFAWYSSSPSLQCFVQRMDASGTELFAHNGVAVATVAGQLRVDPDAWVSPLDGNIYAAWTELNGTQSMRGVSAQRIDTSGSLVWGAAGTVLVPLGTSDQSMARVLPGGGSGGALVVWESAPAFGTDQLFAAHVDASGAIDVPTVDVASTPSQKMRLSTAMTAGGFGVLAWTDAAVDAGDIRMQAIGLDGQLGGAGSGLGTVYCSGVPNSTGLPGSLSAQGSDVASDNNVQLIASQLPLNQFGIFLVGPTQGVIANPGGSQGNLCLVSSIGRYNQIPQIFFTGGTGSGSLTLDLTQTPTPSAPTAILAGQTWNFQAWYRDLNPTSTSNFTDGLAIDFQ
ncbi:MAG: hypothetical protein R3F17_16835 [Planctomycetota bacterium]